MVAATQLLTPWGCLEPGEVVFDNGGFIDAVEVCDGAEPDEGTLLPGFVDIQCNGAGGADLSEATDEAFDRVARALLVSGTTSWCPTLPSAPPDVYPRFLDAAAEACGRPGPRILGVHLEGPFLNPVRAGAHPTDHLRPPDVDWLETLLDDHPGLIRIVTLAPELPGGHEVLALCRERGVVAAVGHSDATADEAEAAFEAGATLITHLFNAMRPVHHRDPGVGGAALADDRVKASLICDGVHIDSRVATFVLRGLGAERAVLVSDSVASPLRDRLTGGFGLLDDALSCVMSWGLPMSDAVRMVTTTPADLLGLPDVGRLEPGCVADAVLWKDGCVEQVWCGGEPVEPD